MIVRTLEDLAGTAFDVEGPGWRSRRLLTRADGMGYTSWRRFVAVDLRLATPTIIAGLRIAAVTTIGLVTVTALIGQGGYGALINDGLSRSFNTPIVVGATLSIVMAITVDLLLVGFERLVTPWARAGR